MKSIFVSVVLLSIAIPCRSQQQDRFDIVTFTSPRGWTRLDSNGAALQSASEGYQLTKCPQLNGYLLEGRYIKADLERALWPDGRQPRVLFSRTGRFEDEGLLCLGISEDLSLPLDELSRRNRENRLPGKGSYAIVDNTLLLNYDDGRRRQLLIYVFGDDRRKDSPDLIVVAGMAFSRAQ